MPASSADPPPEPTRDRPRVRTPDGSPDGRRGRGRAAERAATQTSERTSERAPAPASPQRVANPARPRPKNPAGRRALGEVIRALRAKRGWSQERLALECGYDRAYVGQLERGQRWPTVEAIWYVLHALGAEWTEFGAAMQGEAALRAAPAAREGGRRA